MLSLLVQCNDKAFIFECFHAYKYFSFLIGPIFFLDNGQMTKLLGIMGQLIDYLDDLSDSGYNFENTKILSSQMVEAKKSERANAFRKPKRLFENIGLFNKMIKNCFAEGKKKL